MALASRSKRARRSGFELKVTRQDLDGDDAVKASVAGAIDLSHAASADGRLDLVRSEPAPRNEWHEFGGLYLGASSLLGAGRYGFHHKNTH